ncbi:MAG: penicillin-binding protein 2 [Ferrovum sp.]|nr:penicillin-binding protein 2 [Ferrovum sp.]NDU87870.1 penicillin-binding protein 2 [Ferrovum sp.]
MTAPLRNPHQDRWNFRLRLRLMWWVVVVLTVILLGRLAWLQIVAQRYYHTLAEANRISLVPTVPNRGLILDRNGVLLAENHYDYDLEINPRLCPEVTQTIDGLTALVTITSSDRKLFQKMRDETHGLAPVPIRTHLTEDEVARFSVNRYRFPGVDIEARLTRFYPQGTHASHLIGYIGRINEDDQDRLEDEDLSDQYRGTNHIGKLGIEGHYEQLLHGTPGFEQVETDAAGHGVRVLAHTPPVSGNDLYLTIDAHLQQVAEDAFGTNRGALVAIDPTTGEVLAFVSQPGFDPNLFVDGIDQEHWNDLNTSPDHPLNNRALRGQYPPGSTVKPFMALAALQLNIRTPEYTLADPGYFAFPGSTHHYRDWKEGGHGMVNMALSIIQSCDTYYYSLANEMGIDALHDFFIQFGFGQKSGIDLDGEASGLYPSTAWKKKKYHQDWYGGDTVISGIGQGFVLATPLQLAVATATLANGGRRMKPHLVKAIRNTENGRIDPVAPEVVQSISFRPQDLETLRLAMEGVMKPGGTASQAGAGAPYAIAGKTGTAQVVAVRQGEKYNAGALAERNRDHALFIAYAPTDHPRLAIAVLVENGGHGGATAAPIARQVFDYYLLGKVPAPIQPTRSPPADDVPLD